MGLPQGCVSSPELFLIFVSDLGECFQHKGVKMGEVFIRFLQFADDLVILADSAEELQLVIDCLLKYCRENDLVLNENKTKTIVFYNCRPSKVYFHVNGTKLESVSIFKYLGFVFTNQLCFSEHGRNMNTKVRAKIGYLFGKLPLSKLPLGIVMRIRKTYVLPICRYGRSM